MDLLALCGGLLACFGANRVSWAALLARARLSLAPSATHTPSRSITMGLAEDFQQAADVEAKK